MQCVSSRRLHFYIAVVIVVFSGTLFPFFCNRLLETNVRIKRKKPLPAEKPKEKNKEEELLRYLNETVIELRTWRFNQTEMDLMREKIRIHANGTCFLQTPNDSIKTNQTGKDKNQTKIVPTKPLFQPKQFDRCSILGNSGILNNSSCGEDIDSSDFIFRSNVPPLGMHSNDVGCKSNITSINPSQVISRYGSLKMKENKTRFAHDMAQFSGYILHSAVSRTSMDYLHKHNDLPQPLLVNSAYLKKLRAFWNTGKIVSTGIMMVSVGVSLCKELHLYGFWPFDIDEEGREVMYHYSNDLGWDSYRRKKQHNFSKEFSKLVEMHTQGILKLHIGKCT